MAVAVAVSLSIATIRHPWMLRVFSRIDSLINTDSLSYCGSISPARTDVTLSILSASLWEHNAYHAVLGASIYIDVDITKMNVADSLLLEAFSS